MRLKKIKMTEQEKRAREKAAQVTGPGLSQYLGLQERIAQAILEAIRLERERYEEKVREALFYLKRASNPGRSLEECCQDVAIALKILEREI